MEKRIYPEPIETVVTPEPVSRQSFTDPAEAVALLKSLYERNTAFLRDSFTKLAGGGEHKRYRAFYPEIGVLATSFAQIDSRYAYGHIVETGRHMVVSGGLGCSKVPMRLGVPPEIVRIDLGA